MSAAEFYGAQIEGEREEQVALTQADIDANADANGVQVAVEVRDIPGVYTAARSGEREGWRAIRGKTWSATTVTTIIGSSPFATRMDLWRERMLGIKPTFSPFAMKVMQYGTDAEPELVAEANRFVAEEDTGSAEAFTLTHGYVVDSEENPHYGCTPDAFRFDGDVLELAEFKTGSKDWKGKVPLNYSDQCQWQMMVTGARRVLVVYRMVKRDRQGNVTEGLGHEHYWVEYDEKRVNALLEAVAEWEEMERTNNPPMTAIDLEDQFDDVPDETAEKRALRDALAAVAEADEKIAEVDSWVKKRSAALSVLKAAAVKRRGQEVSMEWAGYGAKLSRSTRTGYNVDALPADVRASIQTKTPVETLRVGPQKGA